MIRRLAAMLLFVPASLLGETIFVSDEASSCVQAVDGDTLRVLQCIEVGARPRGMVASKDGKRLYVAVSNANRIAVIDTTKRVVMRSFDSGSDPETFALSPDEKRLFIGNEDSNLLTIIDVADGRKLKEIQVGGEPEGTAISPDGRTVIQTSESASMAHVIDAVSGELRANLIVDTRPRYVAFTPDGQRFWISSEIRSTVTAFDSSTLKQVGKVDFEAANVSDGVIQPVGIRFTKDGRRAFVALGRARLVAEVHPETMAIVRTWTVGFRAWNLALSPDEKRIYTADGLDGTMSVIDLATNRPAAKVKLGGKPWGIEAVR